jgi:hypothetical protein
MTSGCGVEWIALDFRAHQLASFPHAGGRHHNCAETVLLLAGGYAVWTLRAAQFLTFLQLSGTRTLGEFCTTVRKAEQL